MQGMQRPYNKEEEADKIFCKQLGKSLTIASLFCHGGLRDVCWKNNTAERRQSRRFLECVEEGPRGVPVTLTLLLGKVMKQDHLECHHLACAGHQGTWLSQHGFVEGRSCLANLISLYDNRPVDEGMCLPGLQ